MSLNDIKLSPNLIADLYGRHLVDLTAPAQAEKQKDGINTLIIARFSATEKSIELEFLHGILSACKLQPEDIEIADLQAEEQTSAISLVQKFNPKKLILFGVDPVEESLSEPLPDFTTGHTGNTQLICAPSLSKIALDKSMKMKLWNGLKLFYGIA